MTAAQEQLITDNYALAPYCARKYARKFPMIEYEDMLSLAHIGMVEAAMLYEPDKGTFANFAIIRIALKYRTERTIRTCQKRTARLVELKDFMAAPLDDIEFSMDMRNTLDESRLGTTEREQQCFILYYIHGYTLREIGSMYGITHQRAQQLAERVAKRFRMFWELDHRKEIA
jgi:RNA polymerase sigma factor (sigma-70 family)